MREKKARSQAMRWGALVGALLVGAGASWVIMDRRERRMAETVARIRSDFEQLLAAATHVLRGSLTPIVARAHMLEGGQLERSAERIQVHGILRAALRLERMIDQLARGQVPTQTPTDGRSR